MKSCRSSVADEELQKECCRDRVAEAKLQVKKQATSLVAVSASGGQEHDRYKGASCKCRICSCS